MQTLMSLNVVQILQLGISGLCFLLAFFVYSLLRRAMDMEIINDHLFKLIKMFMGVTIFFVILVFATTMLNTLISYQKIENLTEKTNTFEKEVSSLRAEKMGLLKRIDQLEKEADAKRPKLSINDAWVKLYEDDNCRGREVVVKYPKNISNFSSINFHDKASSVKWNIPIGWRVYLYRNDSYAGEFVVLEGTNGENSYTDLKRQVGRGDEASSLKWAKSE